MQYKLLLIDDEVKQLKHLERILTMEGYNVTAVSDGQQGMARLKKESFDLIISDLVMPDGDGHLVMEYIGQYCPEILFIIITGHASLESAITALRKGAYDYLVKPLRGEIVLQVVKRACEKVQLQRQLLEATQRLQLMAITDALTDVYNQRYFQKRLAEEFERNKRYAQPLSCIMIDVDSFKQLNDTYGHLEGDKVLKQIAGTIKGSIRNSDFLARYGGDEFILLLPQTTSDNAYMLAERIQQAVAHELTRNYKRVGKPTLSLGISSVPHPEVNEEHDLIAMADKALYQAKKGGRNRIGTVN